ncbi:unnamed protein product [Lepeophtheirus salmonis]|uniref:(salmon louse) hypothetical protein n=1 Tax=Lepeophtheirus salmonis TaxID=72036 RepID=A0A7R8H543_LEPSM|nr:unnamed protein product [Lepeophtheirus salmonis]CAF2869935.1 unnamed protein product [Lepeophtheirus salmonis]
MPLLSHWIQSSSFSIAGDDDATTPSGGPCNDRDVPALFVGEQLLLTYQEALPELLIESPKNRHKRDAKVFSIVLHRLLRIGLNLPFDVHGVDFGLATTYSFSVKAFTVFKSIFDHIDSRS